MAGRKGALGRRIVTNNKPINTAKKGKKHEAQGE
jgi:hypothetical protein